jgi:hypothetical protein
MCRQFVICCIQTLPGHQVPVRPEDGKAPAHGSYFELDAASPSLALKRLDPFRGDDPVSASRRPQVPLDWGGKHCV